MFESLYQMRDDELESVKAELLSTTRLQERAALAIRRTFDMLLDGVNTGRFRWEQLSKTEKTHCGTLIEINLQREFKFADGRDLDYTIAGTDVDCKYSQNKAWMIPPEAVKKLCLLLWANDKAGVWSMGLVRAREEYLNLGKNRDTKSTLNKRGRSNIHWLFQDVPLPENVLLRLDDEDIEVIFAQRSGQKRLNELFLRAQGRIIRRSVVETVAMQLDSLRRVRSGGGSRDLKAKGIVVLGPYMEHRDAATALGLPVPGDSEFVSARLASRGPQHGDRRTYTQPDGTQWVVATPDDGFEEAPSILYATSARHLRGADEIS
jgi:hypothetical protein